MTETLPITITANEALVDTFNNITSVSNKLEAQFNFQTLTANWYGDEENILTIQLSLETPASFAQCKKSLSRPSDSTVNINHFSDDVICCFNESLQQLLCTIAITASEMDILVSQPAVLAGFIQAKLRKVLNLIAQQQSLASI